MCEKSITIFTCQLKLQECRIYGLMVVCYEKKKTTYMILHECSCLSNIPWVVRLYVEIIHEPSLSGVIILRTGGQTWYNYFIPPTSV